jgi:hypothetical protein
MTRRLDIITILFPEERKINYASECRGKNGWFTAHRAELSDDDGVVSLDIWPEKYRSTMAPLVVNMPLDTAYAIGKALIALSEED